MLAQRFLLLGFMIFFVATAWPSPASAQAPERVRLSEVNQMLQDGQSHNEVLALLQDRGVGFKLTSTTRRRLADWGFTDQHLELIRAIMDGREITLPGENGPAPAGPGEAPGADGADEPEWPTEFPIGYPISEGNVRAQQVRIGRALEAANLRYQIINFDRFSLYCSQRRARDLVPLLRELDQKIQDRYPESIFNATDPRTHLLILTDHGNDFKKMADAVVASYRVDWPDYGRNWINRTSIWTFWISGSVAIVDGGQYIDGPAAMRPLSFARGFSIMYHMAGFDVEDAMATGLGNVIEEMATGNPSITFNPYEKPADDHPIPDWMEYLSAHRADANFPLVQSVLAYSTDTMLKPHYAYAWSMVRYLQRDPDKLFRVAYRARTTDLPMLDALLLEYGHAEEALMKRDWQMTIPGQ